MADVIFFRPRIELDASENLDGFVESCRNNLTIFGADLDFADNVWDITETLKLKGGGKKRERLVFSTLETANDKSPTWMSDQFRPFAKGYMRYMQGFRPTKAVGSRLAALRTLEAALSENGLTADPIRTDALILNRAAQLIIDRYLAENAYRVGSQLEMIANFLVENRLITIPTQWRSFIRRPGDTVRVGKEFDKRRQEKMPSNASLDALPKIFRLARDPFDVIISSIAAMMCSAPDRISEVLLLPERCEVRQNSGKGKEESYGLRWWPAKGADPMVKWIVPSMVSVVQESIEKIRRITDEARIIAKWYELHPDEIYLEPESEYLRSQEWLSLEQVARMLGMSGRSASGTWCRSKGLERRIEGRLVSVRFSDFQKVVVAMLPEGFPIIGHETGLKYSEALLIVQTNALSNQRGTSRCMIESISINQVNTGLGSRVAHGFPSIFTRFGFAEPDGAPIKITSHQFRHYLNTLAQAGGMSQLDIAKWSGRKDIQQNAVYDHVTPAQMLLKIRDAIGDESRMFGPLAEIPTKVLIPRDEFARLRIPTAHTTDIGFCVHDYTMSPCQLHRDCIHCEDLICVKGDEEKTQRLRQSLEEARSLLGKAEDAVGEGYAGGDRWVEHHKSAVDRLSQLCSIMDDQSVPLGSIVQLAPPLGVTQIETASNARLADTALQGFTADLFAEGME